jgi:CBS domain-containing protein
MAQMVEDIMTLDLRTVELGDTIADAARTMREGNIGNVIVTDGGRVAGIVTDRDIVIRAIAEGREARSTTVGDVCTSDARTLAPEDSVEAAAQAMAENGIRRLPVVDHGKLVGIVSLGDLAQDRDAGPPLAEISAASPNN